MKTLIKEKIDFKSYTSMIGLVLLVVLSSIISDNFLTPINILNITNQIAVPTILAIGMTYVIISGGIDLSVGSLLALTGVLFAMLLPKVGFFPAASAVIILGFCVGALYGILVTKLSIPSFIATLAGQTITKGLALVLTSSAAISIVNPNVNAFGSGTIHPIICIVAFASVVALIIINTLKKLKTEKHRTTLIVSNIIVIAVLVILSYLIFGTKGISLIVGIAAIFMFAFNFLLRGMVFGRNVYAIGGNIDSARLAGINVHKTTIAVYCLCSTLAAVGGVLTASRLGAGAPQVGVGWELDAIAAVIIGGTSFSGGTGKLTGTLIGVLLIGVLNNLLSLMNMQSDMQMIFKGVIILVAVLIDAKTSGKKM